MADGGTRRHRVLCIVCPEGCELEIEEVAGELRFPDPARGRSCLRGREYAAQEIRDPRRVLTTTVRVRGGEIAMAPVKSSDSLRRDDLDRVMVATDGIEVDAPVRIGDIVAEDIAGTGVALIVCRTIGCRTIGCRTTATLGRFPEAWKQGK